MNKPFNKLVKNKQGVLGLYIIFMVTGIILVTVAAVLIPMTLAINSQFYAAGDDLIAKSNHTISQIQNSTQKDRIMAVFESARNAGTENIEINASIFQYGWVFLLIIGLLVVYLSARQLVAYGGGGIA